MGGVFCASLRRAPFEERAAASYTSVRATLEAHGKPIGSLDTLIAGHALALGSRLVTGNTREFGRVEELKLENWTAGIR